MTGQELFGGDDTGALVAVELVNGLASAHAWGRRVEPGDAAGVLRRVLAADPTWPPLRPGDVGDFVALAQRLRGVFRRLHDGDHDAAAGLLNDLLAAHPAHPHLAKEDGRWRLHHHPLDADLAPMATAICAESLARLVGADAGARLGTCAAGDCDRVFLDQTRNGSRRFCSTTCQNRVKAAAFRTRRRDADR